MRARERFEQTRSAIKRLVEVQALIMYGCDDWRPDAVRVPGKVPDPTANEAIRNVDVLAGKLEALRAEEAELIAFIGSSLQIIQAVRDGFGDKYGDVIEWRYVDCLPWDEIESCYHIKRANGNYLIGIACDWVDSVGISCLLREKKEL